MEPRFSPSDPITPELALVDPDLARAARASLPDEPWLLFVAGAHPETVLPPAAVDFPPPAPRTRRRRLRLVPALAAAGLAAAIAVSEFESDGERRPYFAGVEDATAAEAGAPARQDFAPAIRQGEAPDVADAQRAPRAASSPAVPPQPAAPAWPRTTSPATDFRVFTWPAAKAASHYRFRLYFGGRILFEAWPTRPRIRLPDSLILQPGAHRWLVQPGRGKRRSAKYGGAIVDAGFDPTS